MVSVCAQATFLWKQTVFAEEVQTRFLFLGTKNNVTATKCAFARKRGNIQGNTISQERFLVSRAFR